MPHQIAFAAAHKIASLLIESGIMPPDSPVTGSAKLEAHGLQVIVTIARYEPATISAETLAKIEEMKTPATNIKLTPLQKKIVDVLTGQPARKAVWIAAKLGRKECGGSFRNLLSDMVRFAVLKKGEAGGYMLA